MANFNAVGNLVTLEYEGREGARAGIVEKLTDSYITLNESTPPSLRNRFRTYRLNSIKPGTLTIVGPAA